ncbi:MAG: hypothetical protein R3C28_03215 [Pirellulaceae bacterium]
MKRQHKSRGKVRSGSSFAGRQPSHRKTQQLCRQVEETLHYCLSDGADADWLCDYMVVSVDPAPDAAHLLVTLATDAAGDLASKLELLSQHEGRLRTEIANSISRKRVPRLSFRIVPLALAQQWDADRHHA